MNKTEKLKEQYLKALTRLEEVLNSEKTDIVRDAAIQRFEFTTDFSWKYLKALLEEKYGVVANSPKTVIREAFTQGIIPYDDYYLAIIDMRNQSSHTYNEAIANQIYQELPKVLKYLKNLP